MIKNIETNWSDVVVNESDMWSSKISGGYIRDISSKFGVPAQFKYDRKLLDELKENFTGEYVYITEYHQDMDPSKSLPNLQLDNNYMSDSRIYYTKIFQIISFSNKDDAALFKLSTEKQHSV